MPVYRELCLHGISQMQQESLLLLVKTLLLLYGLFTTPLILHIVCCGTVHAKVSQEFWFLRRRLLLAALFYWVSCN